MSRTILITGPPGVGKTTLMLRVESFCRARSLRVGGIITKEVRKGEDRVGFKLRDVLSGREGWLAMKGGDDRPRVGRYSVITRDLETIGVEAIDAATKDEVDVVLVDEIGPMEMTSKKFREALSRLLSSGNIVISTLKLGSHYEETERASVAQGVTKLFLRRENREAAFDQVVSRIEGWLGPL